MYARTVKGDLVPYSQIAQEIIEQKLPPSMKQRLNALNVHVKELLTGLSPYLLFHNPDHPMEDVYPVSVVIANGEELSAEQMFLSAAAGMLHDIGFLKGYWKNEKIGALMAGEILSKFKFTPRQVEYVQGAIRATEIPQKPKNIIEQVVGDADLGNFGRRTYFWWEVDALWNERIMFYDQIPADQRPSPDKLTDKLAYYEGVERFVREHDYHTKTAKKMFDEGKEQNLAKLVAHIEQMRRVRGAS